MGHGSRQRRQTGFVLHLGLSPAERNGSAWRMISLAIASSTSGGSKGSWITPRDVPSRLKNSKSQRNKKSLICSEGEPTLLSNRTDKDVKIGAPLLIRKERYSA